MGGHQGRPPRKMGAQGTGGGRERVEHQFGGHLDLAVGCRGGLLDGVDAHTRGYLHRLQQCRNRDTVPTDYGAQCRAESTYAHGAPRGRGTPACH